jgi:type IV pilus assembly protein PilV
MKDVNMRRYQGIGLIEVIVTAFILSIGLLAVVAMQGLAKRSSYEAQQRTYAMLLAESMMERVHLNRIAWLDQGSSNKLIDADNLVSSPSCAADSGILTDCSEVNLVAADLYLWQQNLLQNNLNQISGCLILDSGGALEVRISWTSRTELTSTATTCGDAGVNRRTVSLTSWVSS